MPKKTNDGSVHFPFKKMFYTVLCISILKDYLLSDCHICNAFFRQFVSALSKKKRLTVFVDQSERRV